jgi:hypothetical protein
MNEREILVEVDDITGMFIMRNGAIDYEASYKAIKKELFELKKKLEDDLGTKL